MNSEVTRATNAEATKEDVANKSTDGTFAANSDTKYPSEKATKTYVNSIFSNSINALGAIGGTSDPKGATLIAGTLSLTPADDTNGGVVTTGAQTFAGSKSFNSDITINTLTFGSGAGSDVSNVAVGLQSLFSNSSGTDNSAVGNGALFSNTSGGSNVSNGSFSLYNNTTGSQNSAVGLAALSNNTDGTGNTAVGFLSLVQNTGSASNNTAVGTNSLFSNATGNDNTAIGTGADVGAPDLTNATAIGSNAIVSTDNTIQLGSAGVTAVNTSGSMTAAGYIVPGGASSDFLKADGSIDNNTYLTGGDVASGYLPLSGGTLTGNLNATTATFTGAVTGITKSMVGLSNVDNTSDVNKPISTSTQTALNLKEDVSNKSTATTLGTSDVLYPTQNAVKTYVDASSTGSSAGLTAEVTRATNAENTLPQTLRQKRQIVLTPMLH